MGNKYNKLPNQSMAFIHFDVYLSHSFYRDLQNVKVSDVYKQI